MFCGRSFVVTITYVRWIFWKWVANTICDTKNVEVKTAIVGRFVGLHLHVIASWKKKRKTKCNQIIQTVCGGSESKLEKLGEVKENYKEERELQNWKKALLKAFFCSLLVQTFGYREMNFQCHVFIRTRRLSPRTARHSYSFVLDTFNTFGVLCPSKGHRVHKYYAKCNPMKSLFPSVRIIYFLQPVHIRSTKTIVTQRIRYLGVR